MPKTPAVPRRRTMPTRPGTSPTPRRAPESSDADAFDIWLQSSLRGAFDAVAAEPVPEDLLRLIEEDRAEREQLRRRRAAARRED